MSRAAVVTGGARGIGAATVTALAAAGWCVVVVDRAEDDPRLPYPLADAEQLDAVVAEARRLAGARDRIAAVRGDAADEATLAVAVEEAERLGDFDAIVVAAGVIAGGVHAWELPAGEQEAVLGVNLGGVIAAARVAMPSLLRRPRPRSGRFVALASAAAFRGMPGLAAYCAAKAGVVGFVRGLAADLRGTGVTANAIAPGSTRTPLLVESARLYGLGSEEEFARQQAVERLLEPAEIAASILWLLSPDAAAMTGSTVPVDGGLSI